MPNTKGFLRSPAEQPLWVAALLWLAVSTASRDSGCAAASDELLSNPGFEATEPRNAQAPAYWSLENFFGGPVQRIAVAMGEGRDGTNCIRIEPKARVSGLKSAVFSVEAGRRYETSMWAKVLTPRGTKETHPEAGRFDALLGDVTLQTYSAEGARDIVGTRTQTRTWLDRRAREWTRVSTVFTTPPDAAFGVLYLRFNAGPDGFLVDDVSVRPAPEIPVELSFTESSDFVTLTASREDGRLEDVYVDTSGVQLSESSNLVPTPFLGFESRDESAPSQWQFSASDSYASCRPATEEESSPFESAAVLSRSSALGWGEILSAPITLDVNEPYVLSVNYAFEGDGQPQLRLIGGDGQEHHQLDMFRRIAPYGWLTEELRLDPGRWKGEATKTARVAIRLYGSGNLTVSGVVVRAGRAAGTATAPMTTATRGHVVSPTFEIGSVRLVRVSWDFAGASDAVDSPLVEMFARVGPDAEHDPRTWTDWYPVTNGGEAFIPIRGIPLHMQFRAELHLDPVTGKSPALTAVRVGREASPPPADSVTQVIRLREGFIEPRDMTGGWKAFPKVNPTDLANDPALTVYAQDRAAGATTELDRIARVREYMMQHLVLYNAYNGGGHGSRGIEIIGQGTGVGCGDVNAIYGAALARLGILSRYVNLGGLDGAGHATVEVWSNDLNKWILSDCFYGSVFIEREGTPLSLAELFDLWRADRMDEVTYAPWGTPSTLMFRSESHYTHGSSAPGPMRKRTDSLLGEFVRYAGGPGVSLQRDGFPSSRAAPLTSVSGTPVPRHAIDYKLNQTVITADVEDGGRANVSLTHNMPGFDRFEVRFDPHSSWTTSPDNFEWALREGHNQLEARAVNWAGAHGPAAEIGVRHWRIKQLVPSDGEEQDPSPGDADGSWPPDAVARIPITFHAGLYGRDDVLAVADLPRETDSYALIGLFEQTPKGPQLIPFSRADGRIQFEVSGHIPVMGQLHYMLYLKQPHGQSPNTDAVGSATAVQRRQPDTGWLDWAGALSNGRPVFSPPRANPNVAIEIAQAPAAGESGNGAEPCLIVRNQSGKRITLFSEAFPISPDTPVEVRFQGRAVGGGSIRLMLRMLDADERELGYVALASLGGLTAQWKPAFFYGVTAGEARVGQLRLDIDGASVELTAVRAGPRAIPESGPATTIAGPLQTR